MNSEDYTSFVTSRGIKYSIYHARPSEDSKPTILFVHGFPCGSYGWRNQIDYFGSLGYGALVPDMPGYGDTDKPDEPELYAATLLAQDLIDIIDSDCFHVQRLIGIGHDWGSKFLSRVANLRQDRFLGFAFLAVGYTLPNTTLSYPQFLDHTTKMAGAELFGYWSFFGGDGVVEVVSENYDAFWDALIGAGLEEGRKIFTPTGAFKDWLSRPQGTRIVLPKWMPENDSIIMKNRFRETGFFAPFRWYTVVTTSIDAEDAKRVPKDTYAIKTPVFLAVANQDPTLTPSLVVAATKQCCSNHTIKYYEAGHWIMWQDKDRLNDDLAAWISKL